MGPGGGWVLILFQQERQWFSRLIHIPLCLYLSFWTFAQLGMAAWITGPLLTFRLNITQHNCSQRAHSLWGHFTKTSSIPQCRFYCFWQCSERGGPSLGPKYLPRVKALLWDQHPKVPSTLLESECSYGTQRTHSVTVCLTCIANYFVGESSGGSGPI